MIACANRLGISLSPAVLASETRPLKKRPDHEAFQTPTPESQRNPEKACTAVHKAVTHFSLAKETECPK